MKPWMLVGAVCAALVGVWGCGDSSADSDEAVVVGQERNGQTVELAVGTPLSVELAGNPTTGYEWTVAQIDSACLRLAGSTYTADSSAIGSGGTYVFRFEPLRAGRTVLGLVYRRAWEITAADQTFTLTVDVRAAGDNPPSAAALENTRWKLAAWSASSLNPAGFDVTAEFADGRIGGRSGVNRYGGASNSFASRIVDAPRHHVRDMGDGVRHRDSVLLVTVAIPEGNGAVLRVLAAGDEGEGNLVLGRITDLLAEAVV